jgi:hypothetical protein
MRVLRLEIRHFRGFAHAVVLPRGHVLVVGEPRAGRSDLLAALTRVLDPDATKATLEEWDFHGRNLARDVEIEVVLGELGPDLRQRFLGELEFWDSEREHVLAGSDTTQQLAAAGATPVLRLAYRGRWNHAEEAGEHWVAFARSRRRLPRRRRRRWGRRNSLPIGRTHGPLTNRTMPVSSLWFPATTSRPSAPPAGGCLTPRASRASTPSTERRSALPATGCAPRPTTGMTATTESTLKPSEASYET